MTAGSSVFTLFPKLPPELRSRIWVNALPVIGPAICRYREGLWRTRAPEPGDWAYDLVWDCVCLDFRPELLIKVPVELPLLFVNREARDVALGWAREHDIETQPGTHVCMRRFDLNQDVIYVDTDQFEAFYISPNDLISEPEFQEKNISEGLTPKFIAISEMAFRSEEAEPKILFQDIYPSHLFVIVGEQPDFEGLWEVDSSRGRSLFWNPEQKRLDMGEGGFITDEGLYRVIAENKMGLEPRRHRLHIEIRPAFAVRR